MTGNYNWYFPGYAPEKPNQKDAYQYHVEPGRPAFEIIRDIPPPKQPFGKPDGLAEKIFNSHNASQIEPLDFGADRMLLHGDHIDCLMKQLQARHTISYSILNDVQFQETRIQAALHDLDGLPVMAGRCSKTGIDLEKQLARCGQERRAEEVACWRDTNRLLGSIFDSWTGYADERRKKRLMDDDL
ncbi:hypothetical protein PDESU_03643 [Pontiella desulfatans]|uniref:Uncharacterized protein n=1 Tax=Pontiella desulfatans TaxID=2750659 RepID=A0A6C2U5A2_PONDE|nr:hypothetical protein [Pontiella desulfatans]VGO15063.1 hypothetical protein PDESU_03643 [Pontiella desulfatans]